MKVKVKIKIKVGNNKVGNNKLEKKYKYVDGYAIEPSNINDVVIVRKYGDNVLKVQHINSYPNNQKIRYDPKRDIHRPSVMIDDIEFWEDEIVTLPNGKICLIKDLPKYSAKNTVNDKKLLNNLSRAKKRILEIALCNDFDLFATFTIDRKKYNRYDLEKYHKAFSQFIRNYNRNHKLNIKYLLVPEKHKDGAWHEHGFFMGLPLEHLKRFEVGMKMNKSISNLVKQGREIYDFPAYTKSFGYCSFEKVISHEKASYYITKYITKDLASSVSKLGGHLYYSSKGLDCSEVLAKGEYKGNFIYDFCNDFCKCQTLAYDDDLANTIVSRIDDKGYFDKIELTEEEKKRGLYIPGDK